MRRLDPGARARRPTCGDQLDARIDRIGCDPLQQRARRGEGLAVGNGGEQVLLGLHRPREGAGNSKQSECMTMEVHRCGSS
jgi:hypothetical protein